MKITVIDFYDGFEVIIDDKGFYFNQEDTREKLVAVFKLVNPDAEVEYDEGY